MCWGQKEACYILAFLSALPLAEQGRWFPNYFDPAPLSAKTF